MRVFPHIHRETRVTTDTASGLRRAENGSAVLVVMILLVIMVSLALGNNIALARLQSELQLVERRQQIRRMAMETNAPTTAPLERPSPRPNGTARASTHPPVH